MTAHRVLIVDDHDEMVAALVSVLEEDARFEVAGTATTGEDALAMAVSLGVDAVLLDVNMPGGGPEGAEALTRLDRAPAVIALSAHAGAGVVEAMLRAGATGFLTKGHVGDTLPDLLARCVRGEVVLASPVAAGALRAVLRSAQGTLTH